MKIELTEEQITILKQAWKKEKDRGYGPIGFVLVPDQEIWCSDFIATAATIWSGGDESGGDFNMKEFYVVE